MRCRLLTKTGMKSNLRQSYKLMGVSRGGQHRPRKDNNMTTTINTKEVAKRLMIKTRLANMFADQYPNNCRENPFYSEREGIEEMLKMMGIDFEYEWDEEVLNITAVTVMGDRVEI